MARGQEQRTSSRHRITRDDITAAGIEVIERDGLHALTIRRTAAQLGCAPMSLYTHIRSRADLIDAIIEQLIGRIDTAEVSGEDWLHTARRLLMSYRDLAVALPRSFELLALAPYDTGPVAPHLERVIEQLERAGLSPSDARQVLGIVDGYASGFLVVWARSRGTERSAPASGNSDIGHLRGLEMFEHGVDALLAGLEATMVGPIP